MTTVEAIFCCLSEQIKADYDADFVSPVEEKSLKFLKILWLFVRFGGTAVYS